MLPPRMSDSTIIYVLELKLYWSNYSTCGTAGGCISLIPMVVPAISQPYCPVSQIRKFGHLRQLENLTASYGESRRDRHKI
jgi:hypothetical protein